MDDVETRERVAAVEARLSDLDALPEPARSTAFAAVSGLVELYGEALARVVEGLAGPAAEALSDDELVGHLMLVHDLHPRTVEERARDALARIGGAELAALEDGVARVRLTGGGCSTCGSAAGPSQADAEAALAAAAPEIERVEVEGASSGVALPMAVVQR